MPEPARDRDSQRVLVVTGISGAGRTAALKALEDLGYEAIDNVPLSLLGNLVRPRQLSLPATGPTRPIAVGVDVRTRDFAVEAVLEEVRSLAEATGLAVKMLFLDCDDDELCRRFAVSRRRHPLGGDRPIRDGIAHERKLMAPLRGGADVVIDTAGLPLGDLKRILAGHFGDAVTESLSVLVMSFSFKHGLPREADLVFDVRFLTNPYYTPELRALTGRDAAVAAFIRRDPAYAEFLDRLDALLHPLLPRYAAEGKSYLTIAVGCTGGQHRSVLVAEELTARLAGHGGRVQLHHRELARTDP